MNGNRRRKNKHKLRRDKKNNKSGAILSKNNIKRI